MIRYFAFAMLLLMVACRNSASSTHSSAKVSTVTVDNDSLVFDGKKIKKTEEEWKAQLSADAFYVLRQKGTEYAFSGDLYTIKTKGVYACGGCGLPLFSSDAKFDSGTGWPSFYQPIHQKNVAEHSDNSHGMSRTEVLCNRCDGHLGHVFDDGPAPTGLRYCINSDALQFVPKDK